MPSQRSSECWNPAVPPPPVAGAALGNGLGVAEGLAVGLGVGVAVGLGVGVTVGLTLAGGVVALAVALGRPEAGAPGEIGGGAAEVEDPEQAETDAEASMANAAQPATVSLARRPVPMINVRIFMAPPHAFGTWRARVLIPVSEEKTGTSRDAPGARGPMTGPGSADGRKGKTHTRHRHAMACSSLKFRLRAESAPGKTR